jgi:predicted Zn-dependent protease
MIAEANISGGGHTARTYQGGAFHPTFKNGRGSGVLTVGSLAVRFTGEAGELELPLAGLNISLGGASDRIVFFKHPSLPESTLHTTEHEVLEEEALTGRPELRAQIAKVHGVKRNTRVIWMGLLLALVLIVVGLFAAQEPLVKVVTNRIPPEWEVTMGDKFFETIKLQSTPIEDAKLEKDLEALTAPLLRGMGKQPYPFHFHIIKENSINAFALPGGHVVIHSELILKADSAEEVAGVLAHEIAHVTKRHTVRNLVKSAGMYVLFQFLFSDVKDLVGVLTSNTRYLMGQKFSRDHEREADETGWQYLIAADVNPRGMITFFEKLKKEQEGNVIGDVQESLAFMSTHPATSERIARLEAKAKELPKDKKYAGFDLNFAEFKNNLKAKLDKEAKK